MSTVMPRRSGHVRELAIGDDLVLYDPIQRRAHLLNSSAAAVWAQCDGRSSAEDVAAELAEAHGAPVATVGGDLAQTLERFDHEKLVGDADDRPTTRTPRWDTVGAPATPLSPDDRAALISVGTFQALDYRFSVDTDHPALAADLAATLGHLLVDARLAANQDDPTAPTRYDIVTGDDKITIRLDDRVVHTGATASETSAFLFWHVHRRAIELTTGLVRLHASAIASGGRAIALPAPPESGKSTLVTGLVAAGFGYLTDEALAFDPITLEVVRLALPITLDHGSWPLFPELDPSPTRSGVLARHIDPRDLHADALQTDQAPTTVALCIFHRYQPDAVLEVRRLEPGEALVALLENAFGLDEATDAVFDGLMSVATTVPCLRLTHSSLDDAIEQVRAAIERLPNGRAE